MTKAGWLKEQFEEVRQEISKWPEWKVESIEPTEPLVETQKSFPQTENIGVLVERKLR